MCAFSRRSLARRAQVVDVVDGDRRDDRAVGIEDVDRIEPAAEADLEHRRVELRCANSRRTASVPNSK